MPKFTGAEILQRLAISPSLLHLWERMLGLPARRASLMKRNYDQRLMKLFESVKAMREEGHDYATITRQLGPQARSFEETPATNHIRIHQTREMMMRQDEQQMMFNDSAARVAEEGGARLPRAFAEPRRTAPIELVEHLNELQDQHTKAVYLIGQLEERLKTKDQRIFELEATLASPDKQFREMLLVQELKDAQKYIGMLEGEMAQLKQRSVFRNFADWLAKWGRQPVLPQREILLSGRSDQL